MNLVYDSWQKMPVAVFKKLQQIEKPNSETMLEYNIKLLSILCNTTQDSIEKLPISETRKLLEQIKFLEVMPSIDVKGYYNINNKKYNVCLNVNNMTTSQYIDYQGLMQEKDRDIAKILACFLVEEGKKYGDNTEEAIEDINNHLSILDANSLCFFFTLQYQSLTKTILSYLRRKAMKMKDKKMKYETLKHLANLADLQKDGVGFI